MLRRISRVVVRLLRLAILIGAIVAALKVGAWLLPGTSVNILGFLPSQPAPVIVGLTPAAQPNATITVTPQILAGILGLLLLAVIGLLLVRRLRRPRFRGATLPGSIPKPLLPQTRGLPIYQPGVVTRSAPIGLPQSPSTVPDSTDANRVVQKQTHIFRRPFTPETHQVTTATQPVDLDNTRAIAPVPPPPSVQPEWPPTPSYGTEYGAYGSYDDLFPPAEPGEDVLLQDIFGDRLPAANPDDKPTQKMDPIDTTQKDMPSTLPPTS